MQVSPKVNNVKEPGKKAAPSKQVTIKTKINDD